VVEPSVPAMARALDRLRRDPDEALRLGRKGLAFVEPLTWDGLARRLLRAGGIDPGETGRPRGASRGRRPEPAGAPALLRRDPAITVIAAPDLRADPVRAFLAGLAGESPGDVEVILVGRGPDRADLGDGHGLRLRHVPTPVAGELRALNTGIALAGAPLIAFLDRGPVPEPGRVAAMIEALRDPGVVAVRGPAGLVVRTSAARALGGFDEIFDRPRFRDDVDFDWRLSALGEVLCVPEVRVIAGSGAPASAAAGRVRGFEKDPVLFEKHPARYPGLFAAEGHYRSTPGFWDAFREGVEKYGARPPAAALATHAQVDRTLLPDWLLETAAL
jgi:hypothetical protein